MATPPTNAKPYKRARAYASLATLTNQAPSGTGGANSAAYGDELPGQIVINFPCLPETIELAREATYETPRSIAMPDGFHFYRYTEPLRIPVKFSLSGQDDDYCGPDGPYALLALTARLHALVMPIPSAGTTATSQTSLGNTPDPTLQESAAVAAGNAAVSQTIANEAGDNLTVGTPPGAVYFPPACVLAMILASGMPNGRPALGINCTGFVERVSVTLRGPWLQGDFTGNSGLRNLPSMADFEFTFVHQPSYTNNFAAHGTAPTIVPSNASTIFSNLYNETGPGNADSQVLYADIYGNVTTPTGSNPAGPQAIAGP